MLPSVNAMQNFEVGLLNLLHVFCAFLLFSTFKLVNAYFISKSVASTHWKMSSMLTICKNLHVIWTLLKANTLPISFFSSQLSTKLVSSRLPFIIDLLFTMISLILTIFYRIANGILFIPCTFLHLHCIDVQNKRHVNH